MKTTMGITSSGGLGKAERDDWRSIGGGRAGRAENVWSLCDVLLWSARASSTLGACCVIAGGKGIVIDGLGVWACAELVNTGEWGAVVCNGLGTESVSDDKIFSLLPTFEDKDL